MTLVFVYGTLKRGQPNHYLMQEGGNGTATFIGEGKTLRKYPLIIASRCNIPFLLPVEGTGEIIKGEVYEADDQKLKRLDALEGHPVWYKREEIPIQCSKTVLKCWCYFLDHYRVDLLHRPYIDKYDSQLSHYVIPAERKPMDTENFWLDVKRPEFYISPTEFERMYPYAKDKY